MTEQNKTKQTCTYFETLDLHEFAWCLNCVVFQHLTTHGFLEPFVHEPAVYLAAAHASPHGQDACGDADEMAKTLATP